MIKVYLSKILTLLFAALVLNASAQVSSLDEKFDAATTLPTGWSVQNLSAPIGTNINGWNLIANSTVIPAFSGANRMSADFESTGSVGTISDWLFTPVLNLVNGAVLKFYTRTAVFVPEYPDRLQVRLSQAGVSVNAGTSATSVGDFTRLLVEINPTLVTGVYPQAWTQYTVTISGLAAPVTGRVAFRYFVTDGGLNGANSNNIALDDVNYSTTPVPVTLMSFDGSVDSKNKVSLLWKTATELNNSHFDIERSIDGVNFLKVASVKGKGNSNAVQTYTFEDMNFVVSKNYQNAFYRLKQVDFDANYKHSPVVNLKLKKENKLNVVSAAVRGDFLKVIYNSPEGAKTTIVIYNSFGQQVSTLNVTALKGLNNSIINISGIASQTLIIKISSSNETTTKTIIK